MVHLFYKGCEMTREVQTGPDGVKCDCKECHFRFLVFENLIDSELNSLCIKKTTLAYKKGQIIIHQGEEIDEFLYLKSGLVKLYKTSKGKDHIISIAKPFDFVSLLTVFSEKNYQYSVAAIENSEMCIVPLDAVKNVIKNNGEFALGIIQKMSRVSDNIIASTTDMGSKNMRGRIAYILLYFANEIYKSNTFNLPVSRREIAELIEMTTENVIRVLSEFRKDQIIGIDGKEISILKKDSLKQLSEFG